jgi:hypothetical protein
VELNLPHKFFKSEELAGYDWQKYFMDRNSDAAERGKETELQGSVSPANNSTDFHPEKNSSTNSEASRPILTSRLLKC